MKTQQTIEFEGKQKLNEMLSDKGKSLIWSVYDKDYRQFNNKVVLTWEAQCNPALSYKLQTTVDL